MTAPPLLAIRNLCTYFYAQGKRAFIRSVDHLDLDIRQGETLGVVGESGSGKSVCALSVMGLVSAGPGVISGTIDLATRNMRRNLLQGLEHHITITKQDNKIMRVRKDMVGWEKNVEQTMVGVRGKEISMIFQDPRSSFNPFTTVGKQISETILLHTGITNDKEAKERAIVWLDRVKMDTPRLRFDNYPYGLSGGMCQRAMIAMALASEPSLLIADEPTTGLDATIQSKIVDLLAELKAEIGITTLLISHDISIISRLADSVAVMYGGTVVEEGPAKTVLGRTPEFRHPYTTALLASIPSAEDIREKGRLQAIAGDVPDTINTPSGCRFFERCGSVTDRIKRQCRDHEPDLREISPGHRVRCWQSAA